MDCTVAPNLETIVRQFMRWDPATGIAFVALSGHDVGATHDIDCDEVHLRAKELLYGALMNDDTALAVEEVIALTDDLEVPTCGNIPMSLETALKVVIEIGETGNQIRTVRTQDVEPTDPECVPMQNTPLLTRILGTIVLVDGVYRVREESLGLVVPDAAPISCESDPRSLTTLLMAALTYDAITGTWFWNAVFE